MNRLFEFLLACAAEKFWGDVLITFKDGRILHIRATAQYTEEKLPRVTDLHRRVMEPKDRHLLTLMIGDAPQTPPPTPRLTKTQGSVPS